MKLKVSELPQTGITGAAFIATLLFDPSSIPVEADSASDGEAYDVPKRVTGNTTTKMTLLNALHLLSRLNPTFFFQRVNL
jgi:hypothetical protein